MIVGQTVRPQEDKIQAIRNASRPLKKNNKKKKKQNKKKKTAYEAFPWIGGF